MRISGFTVNKTSFGRYYTLGREAKSYENMLKPYNDELNKITEGYDVGIETGQSTELHDAYNDQMIGTYPTKITIEPSKNSAYWTIPMIKLYVNHEANPCIGKQFEAEDIINTIKKGISILKS